MNMHVDIMRFDFKSQGNQKGLSQENFLLKK